MIFLCRKGSDTYEMYPITKHVYILQNIYHSFFSFIFLSLFIFLSSTTTQGFTSYAIQKVTVDNKNSKTNDDIYAGIESFIHSSDSIQYVINICISIIIMLFTLALTLSIFLDPIL